jgi:ABC-type glucose/galactose transport system permease subunit
MADTGFNWGSWAAMQKGAGDWTADAIADNGTETGDETSLDGIAACEIGIAAYEDNTGAIDGDVTVYVLGTVDGTNFEETTIGTPWSFLFTPVQNDTVYKRISIDPAHYGSFKLAIKNEGGQELAFTVKYRTATVPVAS